MDQPSLLEIRHFNLAYKGIPALTDLSLAVRPGEIHAVPGENGTGKTRFHTRKVTLTRYLPHE